MKKTLKKLVSAMLAVLMVLGCFALLPQTTGKTVYAYYETTATSGECGDNLTWAFEDGTLTISGTGDMWDVTYDEDECEYVYPNGWYTSSYYVEDDDDITVEKVIIGEGVTGIGNNAFSEFDDLDEVVLPNSLAKIGDDAFTQSSLSGVLVVPENVTYIGNWAFEGTDLTSISIGKNVSYIGEHFAEKYLGDSDSNVGTLTAVNVSSDNQYYSSVDGVLFDKTGTTLLFYPNGKSATTYKVPEGVTTIATGAFYNCLALKSITFPSTLKTIEAEAFDYFTWNLKTVYYNGTESEWNKVSIVKEYYDEDFETTIDTNECIVNAKKVYNGASSSSTSTITVTGSSVNVRKGAGKSYGIVTSVKKGKTYPYTTTKKVNGVTWYKITVNSKTSGWIIGTYVKVNSTTSSSGNTSTTSDECTLKITANSLNVRKGAGTGYGIITSVKKGKTYPYTATKKVNGVTWYKIKVSNSVSGWVSGKYISLVTYKVKVTGGTVNVRKGAGTGYGVLTSVKKGNTYVCSASKKVNGVTWYKIKVSNSVTGWISGKYAKKA